MLTLAFGAGFYFDRAVSGAPHEVTSTTATVRAGHMVAPSLRPRTGAWCWKHKANRQRHKKRLEKLCRTYWRPIFAFLRRQGHSAGRGRGHHSGFFCRAIGAQKSRGGAQGKGTTSFLSAWGAKISFSPTRDGGRWRSSEEKDNGSFRWMNCVLTIGSNSNQRIQ